MISAPARQTQRPTSRQVERGLLLAAVALSLALYLPTLGHWWNSEDVWQVAAKPWSAIPAMFDLAAPTRSFYRPLSWLVYFFNYKLFGDDPAGWHAVNLLWHLATVALLYLTFRRLTSGGVAALATLFFAVHPLHTGAVSWISALPDVQMTCFLLLATWGWLRYRERATWPRLLLVTASVSLALLSKEPAVAGPVVLIAGDLLLHERAVLRTRRTLLLWAAFLLPLLLYGLARIVAAHSGGMLGNASTSTQLRLTAVLYNYSFYFYLLLGVPVTQVDGWTVALALLLTLLLTAVCLWLGRVACFALLWSVLTLLPVSLTVQGGTINDRYAYLPSVGLAIVLALLFARLYKWARFRVVTLAVGAGLVLLMAVGVLWSDQDWATASRMQQRMLADFSALRLDFAPGQIAYFRGVPHIYRRAPAISDKLQPLLRMGSAHPPERIIELEGSPAEKLCLAGSHRYFVAAPDGGLLQVADCQTWLHWAGR